MNGPASMEAETSKAAGPPRLFCLGGAEAPPDLAADLLLMRSLPAEALQKLWQVLVPSLAEVMTKETEQLLDVFCTAYHADADQLGKVIKACRFLVREAAQRDAPAGALAEDLERLCAGDALVKELLLAGYEPAKAHLRKELVLAAVADHGKLLVGVRWRLDTVQASERGLKLQMPVALLTLHYREGGETGRVTLQVLPDMMSELSTVCRKTLGGA